MIRKIELTNFMSHVQTTVEPAAGLTVIAGPNNCGKSAILQAVYACVRYVRGDFMVRHGCKSASVTVTMADGTRIGFRRAGNSTLLLNENEGLAHNNDNAAKAAGAARLSEVGEGADVHFAMQKAPIFLLSDPGSQKARFFASSSDAGKLLRMKALLKARDGRDKDVVKRATSELSRVESQLGALASIDQLAKRVEEADALRGEVLQGASRANALAEIINALERSGAELRGLEAMHAPLTRVSAPPQQENDATLEMLLNMLEAAGAECGRLEALGACLKTIEAPPEMVDESALISLGVEISGARRAVESAEKQLAVMIGLKPPPEAPGEGFGAMCALIESMAGLEKEAGLLATELAKVSGEAEDAAAALARRRAELRTCPLCGVGFGEAHHHAVSGGGPT